MKTLLVLTCAIITFASATYSPAWSQCGNSSDVWAPTSVTVQKDPKNETQTLVSACGTVNSHGAFTVFNSLEVGQNDSFIYIIDKFPYRRVVPSGSEFCLNYSHDYSFYHPCNVLLQITAYNILGEEAGCVNMTLKVPFPESELLFNRV